MTNHSGTTGPHGNDDIPGQTSATGPVEHVAQVTLRSPAELADALPYLLGYRPEDSMVLVALHDHGGRGRFGGRARLGIPANDEDWEAAARQLARGLVTGSERRGSRPERMVAYVCQEPGPGESGRDVKRRLERLAQLMRIECGNLDVPVIEALCVSDGRFWSYCCPVTDCCPEEGSPMGLPGTSVLAAAATYAGIQVRGTLRELRARLQPWETAAALEQEIALDAAGMSLVPRILEESARQEVAEETLALAERIIRRYATAAPVSGTRPADVRDDDLLADDEAATLILGLQDRTTRDRAAAWMEGDEAGPALRLWRALARRCVGPYGEHAAAPLTLAGWVAWSMGDELEAREALAMALAADPDYLFARLLHQACNEGLDPEAVRRCLRAEGTRRTPAHSSEQAASGERGTTGEPVALAERADRVEQADRVQQADRVEQAHRVERAHRGHADAAEHMCSTEAAAPGPRPALAEPPQTPAPSRGADPHGSDQSAEPGSPTRVQRRRRARIQDGGGGHPGRARGRRQRPVDSRPRPSATDVTGPGTRATSTPRTRAAAPGDATSGGALPDNRNRQPERDV
ncbi:DUF4192 domain-containing protein [Streptomyces cinerochromogenes]|uniref:DUF4192 domain-containing protein n=1 Tax=Streptomyces cinerochromogenes TaxID=66422 RepID=UPI0016703B28|nr:DUF4192 domain-containing protein [Streptomyces cinerochromogenes]GGS92784.1 hypothetical protein GCM10010206_64400 [Streptomyces cinerochromogenes]